MSIKVLIADHIKPSIVMSSEIFKDKIPGAIVYVAPSGEEALRSLEELKPDVCLVDFDLPDTDGPSLILEMRRNFKGPIFMSAYPDPNVEKAVFEDLFAYNDCSAWLRKPVRFEDLAEQIDKYLVEGRRTKKRVPFKSKIELKEAKPGRGKKALTYQVELHDISLGGLKIRLPKKNPMSIAQIWKVKIPGKAKLKECSQYVECLVCWKDQENFVGLEFCQLLEKQKTAINSLIRENVSQKAA